MARDQRTIESALLAKGFRAREGDHHFFVYFGRDGKKGRITTKTSHGSKGKTISDDLFSRMARQVKLTNQQFTDLVDCPMDRTAYEHVLRNLGAL